MIYPKIELAQLIVEYCAQYNITDVVISPGSRNAPLTIGFTNHKNFKTYSIVDERCAAFFALGIAQQKQKPVIVVCTSGSALLNYYPAVAEAFYSNIPLIIISADRPKYLIDVGDGQAIRQENVFENHSLFNANLIGNEKAIEQNSERIDKALQTSISQKGPVHINVPFDEPLYETTEKLSIDAIKITKVALDRSQLELQELEAFTKIWNGATKKMVLVGEYFPDETIQKQLETLVEDESVLVFTETTSNLHHPKFINSIDKLLFPLDGEQLQSLRPEILITFGGMVVSKKIKQFLRKQQPEHHWHVAIKNAPDTFQCLSKHFKIAPQVFFEQFLPEIKTIETTYQKEWITTKLHRNKRHETYLSNVGFSDLKAFDIILNSLPDKLMLQLSNSSIIRYSQLFDVKKAAHVFCNRGTSGIDGSTSTAIGASLMHEKQTIFVTGDISFFYDSNALWNNYIKTNFRIVLINNSGGGIFRVIPGPSDTNALPYFETTHNLTAAHLCNMYGFDYAFAEDSQTLEKQLEIFYTDINKPKLLEIFTPKGMNDKVLKKYFDYLK